MIQWRTSGGMGRGDATTPDLEIRADGGATVGARLAGGRSVDAELPAAQLQALLDRILDEHRFFELDADEIRRALDADHDRTVTRDTVAAAPEAQRTDAGATHVAVAADGRRHEVVVPALFAAARDHPGVAGVRALRAIEVELLGLAEALARDAGAR